MTEGTKTFYELTKPLSAIQVVRLIPQLRSRAVVDTKTWYRVIRSLTSGSGRKHLDELRELAYPASVVNAVIDDLMAKIMPPGVNSYRYRARGYRNIFQLVDWVLCAMTLRPCGRLMRKHYRVISDLLRLELQYLKPHPHERKRLVERSPGSWYRSHIPQKLENIVRHLVRFLDKKDVPKWIRRIRQVGVPPGIVHTDRALETLRSL